MERVEDIEPIKENIIPSSKGYRIGDLKQSAAIGGGGSAQESWERERRLRFEQLKTLQKTDPLGPFLEYISWARSKYPMGHASIGTATEQAARQFRKDPRYKNDVRYLELWLTVAKKQRDPTDLFKYLIVNGIGQECALFYEEYAGFKETYSRWTEAEDVFKLGIDKKAEPLARLIRHYESFLIRRKTGKSIHDEEPLDELDDEVPLKDTTGIRQPQRQFSKAIPSKKVTKSSKFAVFQDDPNEADNQTENLFPAQSRKWDDYDTANPKENERLKESFKGATLPQKAHGPSGSKLTVFQDGDEDKHDNDSRIAKKARTDFLQPSQSRPADILQEGPAPIPEGSRLISNIKLCYINHSEYSFEENRATLCHDEVIVESFPTPGTIIGHGESLSNIVPSKTEKTPVKSAHQSVASPWHSVRANSGALLSPEDAAAKGPIQDIFKMFDDQNTDSPIQRQTKAPRVPSPTIHTKEAMMAIGGMFSEPLEEERIEEETDPNVIVYNPEDDETISRQVFRRPGTTKLGVFRDEEEMEAETPFFKSGNSEDKKMEIFKDEDELPAQPIHATPLHRPVTNVFGHSVHVMTPVTECSDRTQSGFTSTSFSTTNQPTIIEEDEEVENTMASLFPLSQGAKVVQGVPNPCNPSESSVRQKVLSLVRPPSESKLNLYPQSVSTLGQRLAISVEGTEISIVEDDCLRLVKRFGESNYYLISRADSVENFVVKIESPPTVWEYYILFLLRSEISESMKNTIISPKCCYLFQNESLFEMQHLPYGSLHDLFSRNYQNGKKVGIDSYVGLSEAVVAFLTFQILSIIDTCHNSNVIHGDVRIGNFLVDINSIDRKSTDNLTWNSIRLVLSDWSASINLEAFPKGQKFRIDPSPAGADTTGECYEFRQGEEWVYEQDWFGIASTIHILIFGKEIESNLEEVGLPGQRPLMKLRSFEKSGWQTSIWRDLLEGLLNMSFKDCGPRPLAKYVDALKEFVTGRVDDLKSPVHLPHEK